MEIRISVTGLLYIIAGVLSLYGIMRVMNMMTIIFLITALISIAGLISVFEKKDKGGSDSTPQ